MTVRGAMGSGRPDFDGDRKPDLAVAANRAVAVALSRHPGDVPAFMSFDEDRPVVNVTSRAPDAPAGAPRAI